MRGMICRKTVMTVQISRVIDRFTRVAQSFKMSEYGKGVELNREGTVVALTLHLMYRQCTCLATPARIQRASEHPGGFEPNAATRTSHPTNYTLRSFLLPGVQLQSQACHF